jgi:GNAT superfamily N-acetyltransferase
MSKNSKCGIIFRSPLKSEFVTLPDKMIAARRLSGLSGPESLQNTRPAYISKFNSHQIVAMNGHSLIGYVLAKTYQTTPLMLGAKHHEPSNSMANTLLINEIAVVKAEQGHGIATRLLDACLTQALTGNALKRVEFCVLSSNESSEHMFTRFANRHCSTISIGACHYSSWGSYIDWTVTLDKHHKRPLEIQDEIFELFNFSSGIKGYHDRRDLICRIKASKN